MGFSVNTNAGALFALQSLNRTNRALDTVQSRINTGLKVAGAKDNAAVFAIAQSQRADLAGLSAVKDSLDRGKSALDVALAGAEAVSDLLIDLKAKAVAAKDSGLDATSRAKLNTEFLQLRDQINTIVKNAAFNGVNALQANAVVAIVNDDASSTITVAAQDIDLTTLGLNTSTISSAANASVTLASIETSIATVSTSLATLGSGANRLQSVGAFVEKLSDSIEVGIGNLVDADLARESARLQSLQVRQQLGLQALSIANQAPGSVLSLFR